MTPRLPNVSDGEIASASSTTPTPKHGGGATVIALPTRQFVIEVTYVMKMAHLVRASTVDEALENAPEAEIEQEMQVVDIVSAAVLREI